MTGPTLDPGQQRLDHHPQLVLNSHAFGGRWEIARDVLPPSRVRPQGGGTRNTPDEAVFAAIVYVLVSGCAWRHLPPCFGISESTAHRRS
ncbi:hypothetical protein STBA_51420 [Streptomyces sp. MP131-18]|nr:hypothetical protein STBA_51420 [Streptomyces sp. MP131-18]